MKTSLLSCLLLISLPIFAADPTPIEKAVASPERTAADRERDARDKPAEVMAFAGVKPGMVVADIFAAGGYYTELLAGAVLLALFETAIAKMRVFRVPQFMGAALMLGLLGTLLLFVSRSI